MFFDIPTTLYSSRTEPGNLTACRGVVLGPVGGGLEVALQRDVDVQGVEDGRKRRRKAAPVNIPPMPPADERQPYGDDLPSYMESDADWVARNGETVRWLIDNLAAIRAADTSLGVISHRPTMPPVIIPSVSAPKTAPCRC